MNKPKTPPKERIIIGKRLADIADSLGMDIDQKVKGLSRGEKTIQCYEAGRFMPSTDVALRYQSLFSMPLEEIFGERLGKYYEKVSQDRSYQWASKNKSQVPWFVQKMRADRERSGLSLGDFVEKIDNVWPGILGNCSEDVKKSRLSRIETGIVSCPEEIALGYALVLEKNPHAYIPSEKNELHSPVLIEEVERAGVNCQLEDDLACALWGLTPTERETLERIYFNDETLQEIANDRRVTRQAIQERKASGILAIRHIFAIKGHYKPKNDYQKQAS